MSDGLKFNIDFGGIDINSVKEAWAKDEAAIQAAINQASKLKLVIKGAEIKGLDEAVKDIQSKIKPVKVEMQAVGLSEYDSKINALQVRLSALRDTFEDIKRQGNLYDDKGLPTAEVQQITAAYSKINLELQEQTKSIQAVVKEEAKRADIASKIINSEAENLRLLSLEEKTLDAIKQKRDANKSLVGKQEIGSTELDKYQNEQVRLNILYKENTSEAEKRKYQEYEIQKALELESNTMNNLKEQVKAYTQIMDRSKQGSAEHNEATSKLKEVSALKAAIEATAQQAKEAENLQRILSLQENTVDNIRKKVAAQQIVADKATIGSPEKANEEQELERLIALQNKYTVEVERQKSALAENNRIMSLTADSQKNLNDLMSYYSNLKSEAKIGSPERASATAELEKYQAIYKEQITDAELLKAEEEKRVLTLKEEARILSLQENTLENISKKISVIEGKKNKSVIGSADDNNATLELKRLNAIKSQTVEVEKRRAKEAEMVNILKKEENTISNIQAKLRVLAQQKDITPFGSATFVKMQAEIDRLTASLNRMQGAGVTAFNSTTKSASNLGFALNGVKQTLGAYASVLGAMRFIDNIREVTAEFELQRVALGAIIQDKAKADQLFAQITQLAVQSPFQVKELITYTKELSAYRIETENLFDTTKRLADISAGLGVDMSRLVLAFGQVKAAQVLRGTELRQFTEAGIDLLPRLAKKFSDMKGEMVSVADVFELISQRAVKFSMVEEIFKDMTDAGGTFYDMQRIQAETLFGSWSNLKDEIALAYNAIGQDNYGLMKGMIDTSRSVVRNMQEIINVSIYAASGFGVLKIAQMGLNKAVGDEAVAMLKSEKAAKSRLAAKLAEKKVLESITQEEQAIIDSSNRLTLADKKRLATNGTLNNTMLTRMFLTGKVSKAELEQLSVITQMEVAEKTRLMNMSKAGRAWDMLKLSISGVVLQLKAMALTLLSNPLTWIIGVVALTMWFTKASREAKKLREELGGIASKGKSSYDDDIYKLKDLQGKLASATKGTKEYTEALSELTNRYGVYLPNISTAIDKNQYLKDSIDGVTESIKNQAKQVALEEARAAVESKNADNIKKYRETAIDNLMEAGKVSRLVATDIVNESFKAIDKVVAEGGEVTAKVISDTVKSVADKKKIQIDLSKLVLPIASGTAAEGAGVLFNSLFDPATKAFDNIASYAKLASSQIDQVAIATGSVISAFREIGDESTEVLMSVQSGIDKMKQASSEAVKAIQASKEYTTDEKALLVHKEQLRLNQEIVDTYKQYPKIISPYQTALDKLIGAQKGLPKTINDYIDSLQGLDQVQKFSLKLQTDEGSLGYFERLNKQIEENTNLLKTNQGQLSTTVISPDARIELTKQNGELELMNAFITMILTKFQQMKGGVSGGGGSGADVRISELKSEISLIETAYKRYKDLAKEIGEDKAKADVVGLYQPIFDQFKQLKGAKIPFSVKDLNKLIKDGLDMPYIKGKDKLELGVKIPDNDWKELSEQAKAKLDQLQSEIEQQQKANKFFESMLGITGDSQLSANITVGIYGAGFADTATMIKEQLTEAFAGIDISLELGGDVIDYAGLLKKAKDSVDKIGKDRAQNAMKMAQAGIDARSKEVSDLLSSLSKYDAFEKKRTDIYKKGVQDRMLIDSLKNVTPEQKKERKEAIDVREQKEIASVRFQEFKESDEWIMAFEDMDRLSIDAIDSIMAKMVEFKKSAAANLNPTEVRELTNAIKKMRDEQEKSNPFKTFIDSMRDYVKASEDVITAQNEIALAEEALSKAKAVTQKTNILDSSGDISPKYNQAVDAELKAEQKLTEAKKKGLTASNKQKESYTKMIGSLDAVGAAASGLQSIISQVTELFGISSESEFGAYLLEVGKALGMVAAVTGVLSAAMTVAKAAGTSLQAVLLPLLAVTAVIGLFTWALGAKKRAADKEIKKQEAIIKDLKNAYDDLSRSIDKTLGEERYLRSGELVSNLYKQQIALIKQANAEASKGKKTDEGKVDDLRREAELIDQQIEDILEKLKEDILGGSAKDFAQQLGNALFDALSNGKDAAIAAWDEAADEIVRNIVRKMLITKLVEKPLQAIVDKFYASAVPDTTALRKEKAQLETPVKITLENWAIYRRLEEERPAKLAEINRQIAEAEAKGLDFTGDNVGEFKQDLNDFGEDFYGLLEEFPDLAKYFTNASGGLTGISKNVAQATEDQITGLAAGINTQNGYFAQTVTLTTNIYALLQKWDAEKAGGGIGIGTQQLLGIQTSALAQLQAINTNTASTASELVKVNEKLDAVIGVAGVAKSKSITVTLK